MEATAVWRSRGRYLLGVAVGAAAIACTAWASAAVACRVSARMGLVVAVGLSLAVAVQSFKLHTGSLFFAAILGLTSGVIGALSAGDVREAMGGVFLDDATPRDALEQSAATRFRFRNARVLVDRQSTLWIQSTNPRRPGASVRHVAPIVDAEWKDGDPVHAWAVSSGHPAHFQGWGEPLGAAIRASSMSPDAEYRRAIEQCGMPSFSNAALLVWVADPDSTVAEWRREVHATIPVFGGFWLVTMLAVVPGVRWVARIRAGRGTGGMSGAGTQP